jgi:hypothetical protein
LGGWAGLEAGVIHLEAGVAGPNVVRKLLDVRVVILQSLIVSIASYRNPVLGA